jgi:capsular exopolysaccharide synthesis family protein
MDLRDYLRILRQRWVLIALVTCVAVTLAIAFTLNTTKQYQSSARLFISTGQASDANASYQGGLFSQERVKSYANLLTGEEISRRVVENLDLDQTPRALASRIRAEVQPETVVLIVSVTDPAPGEAQRLAQATSEVFVAYVAELETPPGESVAPVKASIVDRATLPGSPVSPQPTRNAALALLLGLLAGVGLAVLRDTLDTRIRTSEDLAEVTSEAPVLGNIHFDKGATKAPMITQLDSHAPRVEAFRVLRSNLQFVNVDAANKIFVLTSALPGEGKSSTACNLALTLADAGQKVLLLEGDLRRPRAAAYLGLENSVGVTTVLLGRASLDEAIQPVVENCDLLASGMIPPNPSELLQSDAMKRLLTQVRSDYDFVLIDAPPLLPVTDAALLATESDGAVLVVHHGSTRRDEVSSSVSRLDAVGARLLGTVVNMSPVPKRGMSRYGYGYGYGYAPESATEAPAGIWAARKRGRTRDAAVER